MYTGTENAEHIMGVKFLKVLRIIFPVHIFGQKTPDKKLRNTNIFFSFGVVIEDSSFLPPDFLFRTSTYISELFFWNTLNSTIMESIFLNYILPLRKLEFEKQFTTSPILDNVFWKPIS